MSVSSFALRVAARYKAKKKNPNGGDPIYVYSEGQVARRNSEKATRLDKLRGKLKSLRRQVKKDLKSSDANTALTALAVALIDHTFERVGNAQSAAGERAEDGEKHFGVTGWQKSHISFGKGKATISYVGKSGVKQKKTVTDAAILKALRQAYDHCEGKDIFCHAEGKIDGTKVNAYLKPFGITAKDLRGFHANREILKALHRIRNEGGALPEDKKKREQKLKKELDKALQEVSKLVGHEASTLKTQYLVPKLVDTFLKDGTVLSKMKTAAVVDRYLGWG